MKGIIIFFLFLLTACSVPMTLHKGLAVSGREQPSSEKCSECHITIYNEWKGSAHSRAYTDPLFRSITNDYMVKACVNCHSPESALDSEMRQRQANIDEGVNCQACHLKGGKLQGPAEKHLPFDIHPIMEKNGDYIKSDLCGNCHRKAFEEYRESGEKDKTCQHCHMPEAQRTIIDNKPWVWFKDRYAFKKHSFDIRDAADLSDMIAIEVVMKGDAPLSGEVTVENKSIPHNVPTGGFGYHEVLLTISLIDDTGESVEKMTWSLTQEMGTSLKKGDKRRVPFEFSGIHESQRAVMVKLTKTDFDRKKTKTLAQQIVDIH